MSADTEIEVVRNQIERWIFRGKFVSKGNYKLSIEQESYSPESYVVLRFLTANNSYSIVGKSTYLGCVYRNRYPLPGETWTRGSDLADGDFSEATWNRIVQDILSLELADGAEIED